MASSLNPILGNGFTSNAPTPTTTSVPTGIPRTVNDPVATALGQLSPTNVVTNVASSVVQSVFFSSRFAAIILGLICIAGAIILYVGEDVADALGVGSKGAIVKTAVKAAIP